MRSTNHRFAAALLTVMFVLPTFVLPATAADILQPEILLDRALGVEHAARFDGTADAPVANLRSWRQLRHSLHAANSHGKRWPPERLRSSHRFKGRFCDALLTLGRIGSLVGVRGRS